MSAISTPYQGSIESLGIQPVKRGSDQATSGVLGDWEAKLLGNKKGAYYILYHQAMYCDLLLPGLLETSAYDDTVSMTSITSAVSHYPRHPVTQDTDGDNKEEIKEDNKKDNKEDHKESMWSLSSLPSYNEVMQYII